MRDADTELPRDEVEPYAKGDPTVQGMLDKGLPLCRTTYLAQAWSHEKPTGEDWTAEHELEVPECFRDPDAVKPHPGKKSAAGQDR
jgi:hypothetical protein